MTYATRLFALTLVFACGRFGMGAVASRADD